MVDGWLTIGTQIDDSGIDKGIEEVNSKIETASQEQDIINKKIDEYKEQLSDVKNEINEANKSANEQKVLIDELTKKGMQYSTAYNNAIDKFDVANTKLNELYDKEVQLNSQIQQQNIKYDKLNTKIQSYKNKLDKLNYKKHKKDLDGIKGGIDNASKSLSNTITKVGKWALALFSIRTAYSAISKTVNTLSQYNEQVNSDLQYMQFALAMVLEPIVTKMINLVYTLLTYVGIIAKEWFNVNLFANSSADKFKKMEKSAKETSKSLAGFDTANVLNDNSANTSNSASSPSMDLSKLNLDKVEKPKWLEFIIEGGRWIIDNWEEVVGQLLLIKLVIDILTGNWIGVVIDIVVFLILALKNIGEALYTLWDLTVDFFAWLIGIVVDVSKKVFNTFVGIGKSIGEFFVNAVTWVYEKVIEPILDFFVGLWNGIVQLGSDAWNGIVFVWEKVTTWFDEHIIQPIGNFFSGMWDGLINGAGKAWDGIKNVFSTVATWFKNIFTEAWTKVKNVFSVGGKIFDGIKDGIVEAFKAIVNALIKGINVIVATPFNAINGMLNTIRNIDLPIIGKPFYGLWSQNPIHVPQIQYLKNGGIIDLPKIGVPLASNVVGGEAGPEAVMPLNDENMERIAKYIAKYININIDLTGKIDSRVLYRIFKQIQGEYEFATNGGN